MEETSSHAQGNSRQRSPARRKKSAACVWEPSASFKCENFIPPFITLILFLQNGLQQEAYIGTYWAQYFHTPSTPVSAQVLLSAASDVLSLLAQSMPRDVLMLSKLQPVEIQKSMIKFGVQDLIFLLLFLHDKSSLNCCNELFMSCVLDRTSKTHQLFFPEHQGHHEQRVILHKSSLSLGLDGWILQNGSCQQLAIHFPIGSCHMLHDALTIGHDWTMDLQIRLLQQKWMQGRNLLVIDTSLDVSPVLNSEFVGYWVESFKVAGMTSS